MQPSKLTRPTFDTSDTSLPRHVWSPRYFQDGRCVGTLAVHMSHVSSNAWLHWPSLGCNEDTQIAWICLGMAIPTTLPEWPQQKQRATLLFGSRSSAEWVRRLVFRNKTERIGKQALRYSKRLSECCAICETLETHL